VMKPKPLSSLNHLTVPVAIVSSGVDRAADAEIAMGKGYERWHSGAGREPGLISRLYQGPSPRPPARHTPISSQIM
jgi:hypothetical protein